MTPDPLLSLALKLARERKRFSRVNRAGFDRWCRKHTPDLSTDYATKLLTIGNADDPKAALARMRENAAERNRCYRQRLRKLVTLGRKASRAKA